MADLFTYAEGKTDTSQEAFKSVDARALKRIKAAGDFGITTDELASDMLMPYGSVQPRTSELRTAGLIEDSGRRRQNRKGKRVIVWKAVP
ncbi:MAG: hypothetical protein NXI16_08940 [Alphaproteobacteria bacterium]|nr:hypothetical protein [Alphaproteobacteria bacterium]